MTDTKTKTEFDFNDAGPQKSFDVIPANTTVSLQMTVRPGGAGDGGWLRRSADGASEGLDCEFVVVDGEFAKRKLWQLFTLHGTTPGHAEAGEISRNTLRAILESARGIKPDDKSEAAAAARKVASWARLRPGALHRPPGRACAAGRLCGEEHDHRRRHARSQGLGSAGTDCCQASGRGVSGGGAAASECDRAAAMGAQ